MIMPPILPIIQSTSSKIINDTTKLILGCAPNCSTKSSNDNKSYEIEQIIRMAEKIEDIICEKPVLCSNIETVNELFQNRIHKQFVKEVKNKGYGIIKDCLGYDIYVIDDEDIDTIVACSKKDIIANIESKYW